jgi:hypothetical protein
VDAVMRMVLLVALFQKEKSWLNLSGTHMAEQYVTSQYHKGQLT